MVSLQNRYISFIFNSIFFLYYIPNKCLHFHSKECYKQRMFDSWPDEAYRSDKRNLFLLCQTQTLLGNWGKVFFICSIYEVRCMLHIGFSSYSKAFILGKCKMIGCYHIFGQLDILYTEKGFNPKRKVPSKACRNHFHHYKTYMDRHKFVVSYHRLWC